MQAKPESNSKENNIRLIYRMDTFDNLHLFLFRRTYVTGLAKLKFKPLVDVLLTIMQVNQEKDTFDGTEENIVRDQLRSGWHYVRLY